MLCGLDVTILGPDLALGTLGPCKVRLACFLPQITLGACFMTDYSRGRSSDRGSVMMQQRLFESHWKLEGLPNTGRSLMAIAMAVPGPMNDS